MVEHQDKHVTPTWARWVGAILVIGFLVVLGLLADAMLPSRVAVETSPSSLNLIVANRWVILLIRLAGVVLLVIFGAFAIYTVRSITHRMRHGHWLRTGGPFEAEIVNAGDALEGVEPLFESLNTSQARVTELEAQLQRSSHLIQHLAGLVERATAEGFIVNDETPTT
jgi:hypothetical protein